MGLPAVVAHADWGTAPRKRQVAVARLAARGERVARDLAGGVAGPAAGDATQYVVTSLARVPDASSPAGGLLHGLAAAAFPGLALAGFDFAIGLPRAYTRAAGISSFPEFLDGLGSLLWQEFGLVAAQASEVCLSRPFYPARPGGTRRDHLYQGLGLTAHELRRRCEGRDAETLFWTLGGKQVGKAALAGWQLLAAARRRAGANDGAMTGWRGSRASCAGPSHLGSPGTPGSAAAWRTGCRPDRTERTSSTP